MNTVIATPSAVYLCGVDTLPEPLNQKLWTSVAKTVNAANVPFTHRRQKPNDVIANQAFVDELRVRKAVAK